MKLHKISLTIVLSLVCINGIYTSLHCETQATSDSDFGVQAEKFIGNIGPIIEKGQDAVIHFKAITEKKPGSTTVFLLSPMEKASRGMQGSLSLVEATDMSLDALLGVSEVKDGKTSFTGGLLSDLISKAPEGLIVTTIKNRLVDLKDFIEILNTISPDIKTIAQDLTSEKLSSASTTKIKTQDTLGLRKSGDEKTDPYNVETLSADEKGKKITKGLESLLAFINGFDDVKETFLEDYNMIAETKNQTLLSDDISLKTLFNTLPGKLKTAMGLAMMAKITNLLDLFYSTSPFITQERLQPVKQAANVAGVMAKPLRTIFETISDDLRAKYLTDNLG